MINENQGTENKLTRENDANKRGRLPVAIRYYRLDGRELLQELEKKGLVNRVLSRNKTRIRFDSLIELR